MKIATAYRAEASLVERAQAAKSNVDIVALVSRDAALCKRRREAWGLCPIHSEKTPSFRVDPARQNFRCFGCGAHGDVIDFLMLAHGLSFADAVERLEGEAGIRAEREGPRKAPYALPDDDEIARVDAARAIWAASGPIGGSTAERYLEARGLIGPWPRSLRYHAGLKHGSTGLVMPVLIAAVQGQDGTLTGVSRTYLQADGSGKAGVSQPRMSLGRISGGAVRLARANDCVWITEGIEDALSILQLFQEAAWAVLGTGGFGNVVLPVSIKTVVLAPDCDEAGQAVIEQAAARLAGQGREVRIARPQIGKDWNDALAGAEERAAIMECDGDVARQDASQAVAGEIIGVRQNG